jgi:hypothetical protein
MATEHKGDASCPKLGGAAAAFDAHDHDPIEVWIAALECFRKSVKRFSDKKHDKTKS